MPQPPSPVESRSTFRSWLAGGLKWAGVDPAVGWTVAGSAWGALAGPLGLVLIGLFLSPAEQGLYYLFADVVAIKVFVELGVSYVLMQVVSHEGVTFSADRRPVGTGEGMGRVGAVLHVAMKYYLGAAGIMCFGLLVGGTWFIHSHLDQAGPAWLWPWLMLVMVQSAAIVCAPTQSILGGLGAVAQVARWRFIESVLMNGTTWAMLALGSRLYAVPAAAAVAWVWTLGWVGLGYGGGLLALWRHRNPEFSWRREVWPFQWRIALSWICGFLIFQLFTPIVFVFRGAEEAGRMGMSLAIFMAVHGVAASWVMTRAPLFGRLIATKDWGQLDRVFTHALGRGAVVSALGCLCGVLLPLALRHAGAESFASRMLEWQGMLGLGLATFATYFIVSIAVYLRAFRREPFLTNALVNAVLIVGGSVWAVSESGVEAACWVYAGVQIGVTLPWAVVLFRRGGCRQGSGRG